LKPCLGYWFYWNDLKRYILTAVAHVSKLGYARMYKNKSSKSAADFLYRHSYLVNQPIENLQTDHGSEFAWEFERTTVKSGIQRYFSRVTTSIEKEPAKTHSPMLSM